MARFIYWLELAVFTVLAVSGLGYGVLQLWLAWATGG